MNILHTLLLEFKYESTHYHCGCCGTEDSGYIVPFHPNFKYTFFICFSCADNIFASNPSFFDEETRCDSFVSSVPLSFFPPTMQRCFSDFWGDFVCP